MQNSQAEVQLIRPLCDGLKSTLLESLQSSYMLAALFKRKKTCFIGLLASTAVTALSQLFSFYYAGLSPGPLQRTHRMPELSIKPTFIVHNYTSKIVSLKTATGFKFSKMNRGRS